METSSEAFNENKVKKISVLIIWSQVAPLTRETHVYRRGPLGGQFVQPTWETTYRREFRVNQERKKRLTIKTF